MLRRFIFSMAVVMLVSCGAFAAVLNTQEFLSSVGNSIMLNNGMQSANGQNMLFVDNHQSGMKAGLNAMAAQNQIGAFIQNGSACGECADIILLQQLQAGGMQLQNIGDCVDLKMQGQGLALSAAQGIAKTDGPGHGNAFQSIVLNQDQSGMNVAGSMNESSSIIGLQNSNIMGDACATGQVQSTMTVTTTQTQSVI
ncbi:MAG: hypothetical protein A2173_11230 [Planctomycetes bacterium RBG_13_44_8b]|nr:MAG: hypothetical protein A2173_11230 [Planctomycetes bacterium RBG_13_44_8b]